MDDYTKTELILEGLYANTADVGQQRQAMAYALACLTSLTCPGI